MDGLRCIDDFTLRCLDREHRAYFNTLYAGTTQVIVDLCQEGTYQSGKQDNKLRDISMPLDVNFLIRLFLKTGVNYN